MEDVDMYDAVTFVGPSLALLRMACLRSKSPSNVTPLVDRLLGSCDVNTTDPSTGLTALHLSTRDACDLGVMVALIRAGAHVNATTAKGYSALSLLARPVRGNSRDGNVGHLRAEKARLLLRKGAAVDTVYDLGNTVLHYATMNEWVQMSAVLSYYGSDFSAKNANDETCDLPFSSLVNCPMWDASNPLLKLHIASFVGTAAQVRKLTSVSSPESVWVTEPKSGAHALHFASNHHVLDTGTAIATVLLTVPGFPINALTANGFTPLHFAIARRNFEIVRMLLEHGADVNLRDARYLDDEVDQLRLRGLSPLHLAGKHCTTTQIQYLLDHGGIYDNQLLFCAITEKDAESSIMLINRTAQFKVDIYYHSFFTVAAQADLIDVCQLLLDRDLPLTWDTWAYICQGPQLPNLAILRLFFQRRSVCVTAQDSNPKYLGFTLVHHAAASGFPTVVEFLLSCLSAVETAVVLATTSADGRSPFAVASAGGHHSCVRVLKKAQTVVRLDAEAQVSAVRRAANAEARLLAQVANEHKSCKRVQKPRHVRKTAIVQPAAQPEAQPESEVTTLLATAQQELISERLQRSFAEDEKCCVVCQDRPKCTVLLPCAHLCLCDQCGLLEDVCPLCRQSVSTRMHVFI